MKAVLVREFGPVGGIRLEDCPDPTPQPGEVVVAPVVSEVNFPDVLVMEGRYQIKPPLPFSPGKCGAGTVVSVGPGVRDLKVGDRVAFQVEYGAYAERVRAKAAHCYPMPVGMDFANAAALGLTYLTAYLALKARADFKSGETVLVLGASGGVGIASIQLAKAFGAARVIGAARGPRGMQVAREVGADDVVDLTMPDLRDRLREEVARVTGGRGADVVIDSVGGDGHQAALRALAWCGRIVIVGFASGDIPAIRSNYLLVKNITATGLQWSDYRERQPERVAAAQHEIFELYGAGKLKPRIGLRVPLAEFARALAALQAGSVNGRILLDVNAG
ncbi:MAG: NADPH:quinone oxidoreductase family protein [Variibacter sp.]